VLRWEVAYNLEGLHAVRLDIQFVEESVDSEREGEDEGVVVGEGAGC